MIPLLIHRRTLALLALVSLVALVPTRVLAGPPLICHPYDIGVAQTLPGGNGPHQTDPAYNRTNLVADTLALLTADTPILVRMETLRRSAIYAAGNLRTWNGEKYTNVDKEFAAAIIAKLRERTVADAPAPQRALALFDLGFFTETVRQTGLDPALDGYTILAKSAETLKDNPDVEFALALASIRRPGHEAHLAKARELAKPGSLVAVNLATHFGKS